MQQALQAFAVVCSARRRLLSWGPGGAVAPPQGGRAANPCKSLHIVAHCCKRLQRFLHACR
eukprot:6033904-Alexandrium_andersonii.AAC.1